MMLNEVLNVKDVDGNVQVEKLVDNRDPLLRAVIMEYIGMGFFSVNLSTTYF